MRIQHNIAALNSYRQLNTNNNSVAKNLEKLSSGYRINRAGDDAAGLAISEKMRAQIKGLETAQKNAQDGISLIQTAEGNLTEVHSMLNRMVELATQSANGTYQDTNRNELQKEIKSLTDEIDRISKSANFNGIKLLNGDLGKTVSDALSDVSGSQNLADGVIINAPVDGAGKQHTMEINISGGLFNAGDKIDIDLTDADGNRQTLSLNYKASGANAANGEFGGATVKDQFEAAAAALNAKYGKAADAVAGTLAGPLNGYTASAEAVLDADGNKTGDYKLVIKSNNEEAGSLTINSVNVTDKKVSVMADSAASVGGADVVTPKINLQAEAEIVFNASGSARDIAAGDTLDFTFNINGKDETVRLTASNQAGTAGDNTFRVGTGITQEQIVKNIKEALGSAKFTNTDGNAIDESKWKVSDYFDVGVKAGAPNTLTIGVKPDLANNDMTNFGTKSVKLNAIKPDGTFNTAVEIYPDGTGKNNTLKIDHAALTTAAAAGTGNSFTLTGTLKNGSTFSVALTAKTAGSTGLNAAAGEFALGADAENTITNIMDLLNGSDLDVTVTPQGGGTAATVKADTIFGAGKEFTLADADAALHNGITFTADAAAKTNAVADKNVNTFSNDFNEGDVVTIRGTLRDGSSFSVEMKATAGTPDAAQNQFQIGDDLDATLTNLKAALESADTKIKIDDADSAVTGRQLFGDGGSNHGEIAISTATGSLTFTSEVAGRVGKGGASGVTSVTANASSNFTAGVATTEAGKAPSKAENVMTFDASKIEQGTTLKVGDKSYEFVSDAKYLSNDGNTAIVVANLGKGATSEDLAKAVFDTLRDTNAETVTGGQHEAKLNDDYNLKFNDGTASVTIESAASGSAAHPISDVAVSTDTRASSVLSFQTTTTGFGNAEKTTLNVKAGDTVTIDGKTYEFVEAGKRTKGENNIGVELNYEGTAAEAADKLAEAINAQTAASADKTYNVLATTDNAGNITLVSRFDPNAAPEHAYDAPEVELPEAGNGLTLQVGETNEDFQKVNVTVGKMDAESLGLGDIDISTQDGAAAAMDKINAAIDMVSSTRGDLGALQNRLDHTINNLGVTTENMTAAESRIRDVDMAKEMMDFTKNNILTQAAQAMLAQANTIPQSVLQLLQ